MVKNLQAGRAGSGAFAGTVTGYSPSRGECKAANDLQRNKRTAGEVGAPEGA